MEKEKEFTKNIHGSKVLLIIGLWLIVGAIIQLFMSFNKLDDKITNAKPLLDVNSEGEFAYIEVEVMSEGFTSMILNGNENSKIYFVQDNEYMYLANINNDTLKSLNKIQEFSKNSTEEAEKPEKIKIVGKSKMMRSNLIIDAINYYNENFEAIDLTASNFKEYLGTLGTFQK